MRAAVCALTGIAGAPPCAPLEAGIRLRAGSLPRGVQFCAGGCVREEVVLLGAAALLTGVPLDAAAQGRLLPTMASPASGS